MPVGASKQPGGPIDYASKHWSGLLSDYYQERAKLLLAKATAQEKAGKKFTQAMDDQVRARGPHATDVSPALPPSRSHMRMCVSFCRLVWQIRADHAFAFQVATKQYPTTPVGNPLSVSKAMRAKYADRFAACGSE